MTEYYQDQAAEYVLKFMGILVIALLVLILYGLLIEAIDWILRKVPKIFWLWSALGIVVATLIWAALEVTVI